MVKIGSQVTFHSNHGDCVAWVIAHESGRDGGDHFVAGWTTPQAQAAGQGPYFSEWSVVGDEEGAFSA